MRTFLRFVAAGAVGYLVAGLVVARYLSARAIRTDIHADLGGETQ